MRVGGFTYRNIRARKKSFHVQENRGWQVVCFLTNILTKCSLIVSINHRYEIYLDEVKPTDLSVNFLQEFMDLPLSYLSPGAAIKFRKCVSSLLTCMLYKRCFTSGVVSVDVYFND